MGFFIGELGMTYAEPTAGFDPGNEVAGVLSALVVVVEAVAALGVKLGNGGDGWLFPAAGPEPPKIDWAMSKGRDLCGHRSTVRSVVVTGLMLCRRASSRSAIGFKDVHVGPLPRIPSEPGPHGALWGQCVRPTGAVDSPVGAPSPDPCMKCFIFNNQRFWKNRNYLGWLSFTEISTLPAYFLA